MKNALDAQLEINDVLFREVRAAIKKEKKAFRMCNFVTPLSSDTDGRAKRDAKENGHPCFATACIAGWGLFLARKKSLIYLRGKRKGESRYGNFEIEAAQEFGLTSRQAKALFYGCYWPAKYIALALDKGEAVAACQLITDFLKVKGDLDKLCAS